MTKNLLTLISLTIHFPALDGELIKLVLHTDYMEKTGIFAPIIISSLQSMMNECGLDEDTISCYIVLDNKSWL